MLWWAHQDFQRDPNISEIPCEGVLAFTFGPPDPDRWYLLQIITALEWLQSGFYRNLMERPLPQDAFGDFSLQYLEAISKITEAGGVKCLEDSLEKPIEHQLQFVVILEPIAG